MGKERLKRYRPPWQRALIIILSILFALVFILSFFLIADAFAHSHARVVPDYAMDEDGLIAVLEKPKDGWSDEDYTFVYRQTGLTKVYFDGSDAVNRTFVLNCQRDLFYDEDISHESPVIGASHDCFDDKYMTMVPLERGDVVLSSSVHTLGWSNGHASIVVRGGSAAAASTVQAITVGTVSERQGTAWFRRSSNFMVLRPKISREQAEDIADWAQQNLIGVPYSLFTGIFNAKDQTADVQTTQCAHLVWLAYKAFGYDIDSTGGPVVTPKNIANCDLFEVVQVNGFDLEKLWS